VARIIPATMKYISIVAYALLAAGALLPVRAVAQGQPNMYGPTITADQAKSVAAAAVAEARKNQWTMAVAIVDPAGDLVYFEKMDNTQVGSVDVAISKARASARFKRPTKAFQDALAAGGEGWRILSLEGAVAVEGGLPLIVGGKIVGAIGASGGAAPQDGQTAAAGAGTLK
jgi:glc operon protein GlcG